MTQLRTHRSILVFGLFALLQAATVSHALTFGRIATFTRDTAGTTAFEIIDFCFDDDAVGNLTQVNAPGGLTEAMRFDGRGRKIELTTSTAGTHHYYFTGLGEMVKQTDARGWDTVMAYDALGRMRERTEYKSAASAGNTPFTTTWSYDNPTSGNVCGMNGPKATPATTGKLCEVSTTLNGAAHTRTRSSFDALGRLQQSTTELDRSTPATSDGNDGYDGPRRTECECAPPKDQNSSTK